MPDTKLTLLSLGNMPDYTYGTQGGVSKKYNSTRVFNVLDYGAVADSTNYINGTDNRPYIQAAVDAASAIDLGYVRGATVYIPQGLYHVSGPIIFKTGRAVSIVGADPYATGIGGSFSDYVLNDELTSNGTTLMGVKNLQINNSYQNYLTSCSYASAGNASATTASISGTVLTVTSGITGTFAVGQIISTLAPGQTVTYYSIITSLGTGSGGAGTYNLNKSSTMSASGVANAIVATDGGVVTFGTMNAINGGSADPYNIPIGTQFHTFGMYPRLYNGRYVAVAGTTGSTLVGVGNCLTNPGSVTMLGALGGGCIRMDQADMSSIEKCKVGAFNALHLGGHHGYGGMGNPYNVFGISVKDTSIQGGKNGEYGTVGAFCGQVSFDNSSITSWDIGIVASGNGFGYQHGHIETNNTGIILGRSDQLTATPCGAWNIISSHSESCSIAVDIWSANQGFMSSCQWSGQHAGSGGHNIIPFTANCSTGVAGLTNLAAVVVTGNTTIRSPRITNLSSMVGLVEHMQISGTGIPAGSTILTIDSANSLTFINEANTTDPNDPQPLGASATGSTITITATLAPGMIVTDNSGTKLPAYAHVTGPIGTVTGGTYSVTLDKAALATATAASFGFNGTPKYGMRLRGVSGALFATNNTSSVAASVAGVGLLNADAGAVAFVGHSATLGSGQLGLGPGWLMPVYGTTPANGLYGISYIQSDNPSSAIPFGALPASPVEGTQFSITDCNTATFLATAAAGGTGATAHRLVRYNATAAVWQVIG